MLIDNSTFFNLYNLIYFCTACLVVVSVLSCEIKKDILLQNKLGNYFVFFPLIFLILLVGLREYNVGTDTGNYYNGLWLGEPELNFNSEFLFDLLVILLRNFDLSYTFFLFLVSFLFYVFLYGALKKYTKQFKSNLFFAFFTCISLFFFLSMSINVIRQGVSLSILLFSYTLWVERKSIFWVLFFVFLALAFHLTSIIPILIFIVSIFFSGYKYFNFLVLIYFFMILVSYFNYGFLNISPLFLDFLGEDKRAGYFTDDDYGYQVGFKPQFVIFNTFFLLLSLYVKNKLKGDFLEEKYTQLVCYYILSSIIFFMAFQLPFSDRWGLFSWIAIPFLVIPLFYSPFVKGNIKIHYILMFIAIYIGFNFYV
ncbi:EpsG family protein [Acinetobacter haemolyticus]|uniref:EpsG family protein n=1 Tax=Acinetobacter haemolyticus TaxID=29430 RepID=UPI000AF04CF4|nr:EpsG family protein [Acinetobacter haemolyticus]QHI27674.1 EpsG family protein [Acinetobacter haemolyticus]